MTGQQAQERVWPIGGGRQSQSVGHWIGWLKPWSCAIYMLLNGGVVEVINVTSTGECGAGVYRHPSRPLCLVIDGLCCWWDPVNCWLLLECVNGLLIGWMDVFLCTFIDIIVLEDVPNEDGL